MNTIMQWAQRHGVPQYMVTELMQSLYPAHIPKADGNHSESWVAAELNVEASYYGARLWRNNVGATKTDTGFLRYGLCNESSKMNDSLKSSDYIGVTPIVVQPSQVGSTIGVFTAIETKRTSWKFTGAKRETAQLNYINLVKSCGGIAGFVNDKNQFLGVMGQ